MAKNVNRNVRSKILSLLTIQLFYEEFVHCLPRYPIKPALDDMANVRQHWRMH